MSIPLHALLVAFSTQAPPPSEPNPYPSLTSGYFVMLRIDEFGGSGRAIPTSIEGCAQERVEQTAAGLVLRPAGTAGAWPAWIELPVFESPSFHDVVCSWNARVPDGTGICFELRVADGGSPWSPWLYLGDAGEAPAVEKTTSFDGGRIEVDCFVSERQYTRAQLRVRATRISLGEQPVVVERASICVSHERVRSISAWSLRHHRERKATEEPGGCGTDFLRETGPSPGGLGVDLPVPFRSQKVEEPKIAGRICSPTSVAMVLAYRGVDISTAELSERIWDREHGIYGNWPRAVQCAFELGVPGYLTRISHWDDARAEIAKGQPLVISIQAEKGQLTGAPYEKTDGHLLVLRGFDAKGDCLVNDPAARDAEHGQITYARAELEACWMGHGGVAYVLLPRPEKAK